MKIFVDELSRDDSKKILEFFNQIRDSFSSQKKKYSVCSVCSSTKSNEIGLDIIRLSNTRLYVFDEENKLLQCDVCGCVRTSYLYPPEYYITFLNNFYGVIPTLVASDMIKKAELRGQLLKKISTEREKKVNSILEISSYDGITLNYLHNIFSTINKLLGNGPVSVFGVEPTTNAFLFAENTYPNLKGRMLNNLAEQLSYSEFNTKLDCVIFSYAMRMMSNPLQVISNIKKYLNSGAIFLVHESSLINTTVSLNQEQQYYRQFAQQKINYFSSQGLRYLMEKMGFRYIESITHDSEKLQGTLLVFVYDENVIPEKELLFTSKKISNICVKFWQDLQKNQETFRNYLKILG